MNIELFLEYLACQKNVFNNNSEMYPQKIHQNQMKMIQYYRMHMIHQKLMNTTNLFHNKKYKQKWDFYYSLQMDKLFIKQTLYIFI